MPAPKKHDPKTSAPTFGSNIPAITATAGASYTVNEQAMLNALKAAVNEAIATVRGAGLIQQD